MTIEQYLAEQGLTPEEITAIVGNEKAAKAMTAALTRYSEGTEALTRAQAEKTETATFWEQKTQELQGSVDRLTKTEKRAAIAEAERAQYAGYLKSLKDQGYDVPDDLVSAPANNTPAEPQYMTRADYEKGMRATAPDLVALTALSNEYYDLHGSPYLAVEADYAEAQKSGKSLREYARAKYNFEGKKNEKAAAADQKRIDDIVNEKMKTREAELAAKYGSNGDLRTPMPSKFDQLKKRDGFKSDSWKSQEGRDASRQDRLQKFENIKIQ